MESHRSYGKDGPKSQPASHTYFLDEKIKGS